YHEAFWGRPPGPRPGTAFWNAWSASTMVRKSSVHSWVTVVVNRAVSWPPNPRGPWPGKVGRMARLLNAGTAEVEGSREIWSGPQLTVSVTLPVCHRPDDRQADHGDTGR